MQIEIGTRLKFQAEKKPRTVGNILLNYDYESVTVVFLDGESVDEKCLRELLDLGRVQEVFS